MEESNETIYLSSNEFSDLLGLAINTTFEEEMAYKLFAHRLNPAHDYIMRTAHLCRHFIDMYDKITDNGTKSFDIAAREFGKANERGAAS